MSTRLQEIRLNTGLRAERHAVGKLPVFSEIRGMVRGWGCGYIMWPKLGIEKSQPVVIMGIIAMNILVCVLIHPFLCW